jgi:hypothetical protein
MLRASCSANDIEFQLASVVDSNLGNGVAHYHELINFTEALLKAEVKPLDSAREKLRSVVGDDGVVRASAVVGNFQMMNRALDTLGAQLGREVTPELIAMAGELDMSVPKHWE